MSASGECRSRLSVSRATLTIVVSRIERIAPMTTTAAMRQTCGSMRSVVISVALRYLLRFKIFRYQKISNLCIGRQGAGLERGGGAGTPSGTGPLLPCAPHADHVPARPQGAHSEEQEAVHAGPQVR